MAEIPTFSSDDPIISNIPLNPAGEGNIKIANMIQNVSKDIIGSVLRVKQATSNAALFSQNSALDNAKKDALTQIQLNPANASQVANNFNKHIDLINRNIQLIPSDQQKLTILSRGVVNSVQNTALLASAKHIRLTEAMNFRTSFPDTLTSIAHNLQSDPKAAQAAIQSSDKIISDGLLGGFITPTEASNAKKSINSVINRHQQLVNFVKGGSKPIDGLHALTNIPGEPNSNLPTQSGTFFHYVMLNQNVSFKDAISDLHKGNVDGDVISSLSPTNFTKYMETAQGIDDAQATINSGNHYDFITKRFNFLNTKPASNLSIPEKAERDQYAFFIKNINNRNMLPALARTSQGSVILGEFNDTNNAIKNNGVLSEIQKQQEFNNQFTKTTNQMVSLAQSLGIPTDKINPIPVIMQSNLNNAYNVNPDPNKVMNLLNKFTPNNGIYLANALKDPVQQETMNTVNNLRGKNEEQFSNDMILATGKNQDFSDIKPLTGITDNSIKQQLLSDNTQLFNFIAAQPNGQQRIVSILNSGVKYIKFRGQQKNDLSLDNLSTYESDFKDSFAKSISLDTGSNFSINSELIGTTHAENQALADYFTQQVKQEVRTNSTDSHANTLLDMSPLRMISTPDGHLMIMNDRNTQIGKKILFTSEIMEKANAWERKMDKINKPSVSSFGRTNLENNNLISKAWDDLHPTIGLEVKDSDIANQGKS